MRPVWHCGISILVISTDRLSIIYLVRTLRCIFANNQWSISLLVRHKRSYSRRKSLQSSACPSFCLHVFASSYAAYACALTKRRISQLQACYSVAECQSSMRIESFPLCTIITSIATTPHAHTPWLLTFDFLPNSPLLLFHLYNNYNVSYVFFVIPLLFGLFRVLTHPSCRCVCFSLLFLGQGSQEGEVQACHPHA